MIRSAEWRAPEDLVVVDRELPEPRDGEVLLAVNYCGICGTDLHAYHHGLNAEPGQILGHEFTGTVLAAPGVAGVAEGDEVTVRPLLPCGECDPCLAGDPQLCERSTNIGFAVPGGFAEQVLVPRAVADETVFVLPAGIDPRAGALVEPLAVALHAINRADPGSDATVVILGAGMIGLGLTALLSARGVGRVLVSDVSELRRERALRAGADQAIDPLESDLRAEGKNSDFVFDAAGVPAALPDGLACLRKGGTAVMVAGYGPRVPISIDRIVGRELNMIGSIAYRDEFPAVIEMLASGQIDPDLLITHVFGLEDIDHAFRTQADAGQSMKVLVTPNAGAATN